MGLDKFAVPLHHGAAGVSTRWRFWIDRGGTFTDVIGCTGEGRLHTLKLLSNDPTRDEDAALAGIRRLLGVGAGPLPVEVIEEVRIGTTVATNALLERKGAPTLFVTNAGFEDALLIRDQARPRLFDLDIRRPAPLYDRVLGVRLRVDSAGHELASLDEAETRRRLQAAGDAGLRACAICLLHAWRFPEQEKRLARLARAAGFATVVTSHEVSPLIRYLPRAETVVIEAYLQALVWRYTRHLAAALPGVRLLFMKSDGGLAAPGAFDARQALLSGPAGGVLAVAKTAVEAGFQRAIGFDMGGTSTDVCHYAGNYEHNRETVVGGHRLATPALALETVAAGGGSIVAFDGTRLTVGPHSAGAEPGPACYRRGGPLTITDCNLLLGRIRPAYFPRVFGINGDQPLDIEAVRNGFSDLAAEVAAATGNVPAAEELADGAIEIAVEHMAAAIKRISIARGHDPTRCVLNCFGGAGGQLACRVADALGMETVLIHPHAGVLSAFGIGRGAISTLRERSLERALAGGLAAAHKLAQTLEAEARAAVYKQGAMPAAVTIQRVALLRYADSETAIPVPLDKAEAMGAAFTQAHRRRFGFVLPGREQVIASVRVEARMAVEPSPNPAPPRGDGLAPAEATAAAWFGGSWRKTALYRRENLAGGSHIRGPAIVIEATATSVIEPGWEAMVHSGGELLLSRAVRRARKRLGTRRDPVALEIMGSLFMSAAEQMGEALRQSAQSVNVRERLDFSCALFAPDGKLVANAPHVPVHLGAMSATVRTLIARQAMKPGEAWVTNDPYSGGTHLPDITVVTPIFFRKGGRDPDFFVASRAHHADLGGITPGSMPPDSRRIEDEGILIRPLRLVSNGYFNEQAILRVLADSPHPARRPEQNLADLRAQVAANERGRRELERLVRQYGLRTVRTYMAYVNEQAAAAVRRLLRRLPTRGQYTIEMDNGAIIRASLEVNIERECIIVDFDGTSATGHDNFNAPPAVVRAAVIYVLRSLVEEEVPLNDGCLENVEIRVPPGNLLAPGYPAAVVAGNVEVSQCLCDALYAATGTLAASQGTMNNLSFGNARFQHYETLAGGAGAGPGFPGASAVHTHMTNSRLTDPEILEFRYPIRVECFSVRRGTGGAGQWHGGDGLVRRLRLLEPMTLAILSNRRRTLPFGLGGGSAGRPGVNRLIRGDGRIVTLKYADRVEAEAGDAIEILTPGGGGYGPPQGTAS